MIKNNKNNNNGIRIIPKGGGAVCLSAERAEGPAQCSPRACHLWGHVLGDVPVTLHSHSFGQAPGLPNAIPGAWGLSGRSLDSRLRTRGLCDQLLPQTGRSGGETPPPPPSEQAGEILEGVCHRPEGGKSLGEDGGEYQKEAQSPAPPVVAEGRALPLGGHRGHENCGVTAPSLSQTTDRAEV